MCNHYYQYRLNIIPDLMSCCHLTRLGTSRIEEGKKDNEKEEWFRRCEGERLRVTVKITSMTHCALDYFCHKVWKYNPKGCGRYTRRGGDSGRALSSCQKWRKHLQMHTRDCSNLSVCNGFVECTHRSYE